MANVHIDTDRIREQAEHASAMALLDHNFVTPMPAIAPMAPMAPMVYNFGGDRFERMIPVAPWGQADPADSLYNLARDLVSRGDWGRSARLFADIQSKYPKSSRVADALYWEAYSRYKIGTTDELRAASRILEPVASKLTPQVSQSGQSRNFYSDGRRTPDNDVLALYARVNGALAQRGDSDAAAKVRRLASTPGVPCDQEEISVQSEALNALSQIDAAEANKILRRVIERKDDCSATLRRSAVFMLGRRGDPESASLLLNVAKSDPSMNVRTEAISFLGRMPGDAGVSALEEMLRADNDERIQRAAIGALMRSDNAGARSRMRALIDRKDAPMNLRIEAINSFNSERATDADVAYLKSLFGKAESDQMKNAILNTVSRIGGADNDQWVLNIAKDKNESSQVRSSALSRFANRGNSISTADLAKLYDASGEWYDIRIRLINLLGGRKDQESTDKLIEIAKSSTGVDYRKQAINQLMNRKDPRAAQLFLDILDGKKP
jgi:HEAT repeat protein